MRKQATHIKMYYRCLLTIQHAAGFTQITLRSSRQRWQTNFYSSLEYLKCPRYFYALLRYLWQSRKLSTVTPTGQHRGKRTWGLFTTLQGGDRAGKESSSVRICIRLFDCVPCSPLPFVGETCRFITGIEEAKPLRRVQCASQEIHMHVLEALWRRLFFTPPMGAFTVIT